MYNVVTLTVVHFMVHSLLLCAQPLFHVTNTIT